MLSRIKQFFAAAPAAPRATPPPLPQRSTRGMLMRGTGRASFGEDHRAAPDEPVTIRRWEGAMTDRLNAAHWSKVGYLNLNTINADLWFDLPTLRAGSIYELRNNPMVEGVVETHKTDLIGPDGPTLKVQSDSDRYNRAAEGLWQEWWELPDINGVLSGVDMLRLDIDMFWSCGEALDQLVTDESAIGPVKLRILSLHPARLMSPPWFAADPLLVLGILRSREGKPRKYFIAEPLPFGAYTFSYNKFNEVAPDDIIHQFKHVEPGQARGFPWLAPSLQPIADLRDYDSQVMDAARAAADQATYLYSDHPDAPFFETNELIEVERRTVRTLPPGWKPSQMDPKHPAANYVEYRKERQREIGRPVNMPLMMVRLSSDGLNYSSARFDAKLYNRSLATIQAWITRNKMRRLQNEVLREAELAGATPRRPKSFKTQQLVNLWPAPVDVDPEVEMEAYKTAMEIGVADQSEVAARMGKNYEELIAHRKRTMEMLTAANLPPAPYWQPQGTPGPKPQGEDQEEFAGAGGAK